MKESSRLNSIFSFKEFFDRIGFGSGSQQFINILFFIIGAAPWLVFFINSFRVVFSTVISSFFKSINLLKGISKSFISFSGFIYGFSFLGIAFATLIKSLPLFILSLFIGTVGVVAYGDSYNSLVRSKLPKEKRNLFLRKIGKLGVLLTAFGIIIAGYLMDLIPIFGSSLTILGIEFTGYGYLFVFEITAISFIISGYALSFLKEDKKIGLRKTSLILQSHFEKLVSSCKELFSNKVLLMLTFAGSLTAFAQTLANSFYGIYIYKFFGNSFLTVALVLLFGLFGAPFGLGLGKFFSRKVGVFPLLVFGSLLLAITPFTYYFSTNIFLIAFATFIGFMGGSIIGVSSSILSSKLLPEFEKKNFYDTSSVMMIIPYFLFIPLGSFLLVNSQFKIAFLIASLLLIVFVAPIYLILLISYSKYN